MGKRSLFNYPALSCSAHVSGKCFSSRAWQTAWGSCWGHAQWWLQTDCVLNGFWWQSLLRVDPAGNARPYLALHHFIPWHRLSPPFLLQSLSLLPQASPTVETRDLKTDHTVTQWCHALSYHRRQIIGQTFSFSERQQIKESALPDGHSWASNVGVYGCENTPALSSVCWGTLLSPRRMSTSSAVLGLVPKPSPALFMQRWPGGGQGLCLVSCPPAFWPEEHCNISHTAEKYKQAINILSRLQSILQC